MVLELFDFLGKGKRVQDRIKKSFLLWIMFLYLLLAGCANTLQVKQSVPEANLTRSSSKLEELINLPKPDRKIIVTVYRFQDKTGQFNDSDKLRYSTAVTQGATSQLITALMRAKYFTVVERAHLDDLITEQKLKIEKRVQANTGPQIGKLYGAEYIITGDITEYNVDVITAGAGVRVSGAGGSAQVAVATAAIDLRIVESTTGRIVFNKSLRKSIVGKQVGLNIFRFWDNRLYEINGGIANQEPIQLAIRELLEEGVHMICTSYAKAYEKKKVAKTRKPNSKKMATHKKKTKSTQNKMASANKQSNPVSRHQNRSKTQPSKTKRTDGKESLKNQKTASKGTVSQGKSGQQRPVESSQKTPAWAKNMIQATVNGDVVNVRKGPGLEYRRVFQVRRNHTLYVLEKNLVWNLVRTARGEEGWVRADTIRITSEPASAISLTPDIQRISDQERGGGIEVPRQTKNLI